MRTFTITAAIVAYKNIEELPDAIKSLMQHAIEAKEKAYAPYSKFSVGAALLLENGEIVTGSNQENASYPSGLCAERVAIYHAGATNPNIAIKSIAITVSSESYVVKKPAAPCGACRQSIAEYEFKQKSPIEIYFMGEEGEVFKTESLKDIMPLGFDSTYL